MPSGSGWKPQGALDPFWLLRGDRAPTVGNECTEGGTRQDVEGPAQSAQSADRHECWRVEGWRRSAVGPTVLEPQPAKAG